MIKHIQNLSITEIARAVNGELIHLLRDTDPTHAFVNEISSKSGKIGKTCLFVPIKGEKFDGHDYIADAVKNGAIGYITERDTACASAQFAILVKDTKKALLDIATAYRNKFNVKITAITGSVGKTTTKELTACAIAQNFNTVKTEGNHNNEIGFPFTVFGLNESTEAAVLEMGMSGFGEIEGYSLCVRPNTAIITNIGTSHIEHLKSREGILKAKCEIFAGMDKNGCAILNGDDPFLYGLKGILPFKTVFFGTQNADCDILARDIVFAEDGTEFTINGAKFFLPIPGAHNILNALAAYAAAHEMGVSDEQIAHGFLGYKSDGIRQTIEKIGGVTYIIDCYNASPQSVAAALDLLSMRRESRKIAVLGDMAELGDGAVSYHHEVGKYLAEKGITMLIAVGKLSKTTAKAALECDVDKRNIIEADTAEEAAKLLKNLAADGDAVLVKGSRCMKMERIIEELK